MVDWQYVAAFVGPAIAALWAWMRDVQRRANDKVDSANAERDQWAKRWAREVEYGAQRAVEPAPRSVPLTLPPPSFKEPPDVRARREELEARRLTQLRLRIAPPEFDTVPDVPSKKR